MIHANIVCTGLDSTENPYPGLSVLRSIKESGEFSGKTIVLTYDSLCTGLYQHNFVDEVYLVPYPSEPEEYLLSRIAEIHKKAKIDVMIPCLDSEIATYARLKPRLKNLGIKVLVPREAAVKVRSKIFLSEFCKENEIEYPKSFLINDPNEIEKYAAELHYPLMLKGSIIDTAKVEDSAEARVFFHRLANEWGLPLIIQEHLDGEEYDVAVLADQESQIVAKVAMRKIGITKMGKAFAGVTVESKEFDALAEKVVKALQWQGPLELELMKNSDLNKTYIIEINARFPSWIYTTLGSKLNLPLLNLKLALGETLGPQPDYKTGVMFTRIVDDSYCDFSYLAQLNLKGELDWTGAKLKHKTLLEVP
ncbi:MAG: ATP-grasp domain-containing protein [Candidatus Omnitrophica bacterium]|nr:ATP-grasp domain-containing protein [Candidatus Omnitrophota bacterium]